MKQKDIGRLGMIASNTMRSISAPVSSAFISIMIIRVASKELWGEMTGYLIVIALLAHISGFGNKEYLLRAFSKSPATQKQLWLSSFAARNFILLIFCGVMLMLPFSWTFTLLSISFLVARYICQSYDPVSTYKRNFTYALIGEGVSLMILACLIYVYQDQLGIDFLLFIFTISEIVKAFMFWIVFRNEFPLTAQVSVNKAFVFGAFPFFLLGFSGLLQSKADQLTVILFLKHSEVGEYQVLTNFYYLIMAIPGLAMNTYLKNFYRSTGTSGEGLNSLFLKFGLLFIPIALVCVYGFMHMVYGFDTSWFIILLGFFYIIPTYYYTPYIYRAFKQDKAKSIVMLTFSGIALNWLLSIFLIPYAGFQGALISTVLAQWMVLSCYVVMFQLKKFNSQLVMIE